MLLFLSLFVSTGCSPALISSNADATVPEVRTVDDQVIIRDCFGDRRHREGRVMGRSVGASQGSSGFGSGAAATSRSAPAKKSKAMPAPAPSMSAPPEREESSDDVLAGSAVMPPTKNEVGDPDVAIGRELPPHQQTGPSLDWGGTTWLSNDDSMSLASAQRVLFAMENNRRVSASEVRPHELLNYFSFDSDTVKRGHTFSVMGSARKTEDDQLSVALSVKGGTPKDQPLDLTVVVDRSGSMSAEGRMAYTKRGLQMLTDNVSKGDRVDIVLFDNQVCTPVEGWMAGRDNPSIINDVIEQMSPRGSTDLDSGLREAYRIADSRYEKDGRNRRVMLLTDAYLNTGNVNTDLVSEVGKQYEERGIRVTGVGVGRDFNDKMLNKLTEKSKGAYVYLGSEAVVDRIFGVGFDSMVNTIAHDVHFELELPESLAIERFYGEESSTVKEDVAPIHYYAGTTQLFLQDLAMKASISNRDKVNLRVHYTDAISGAERVEGFTMTVGELLGSGSQNVEKAHALMSWTDMIVDESLSGNLCGKNLSVFRERAATLSNDSEIGWISTLVDRRCGVAEPVVTTSPVESTGLVGYKVKLDSDIPIGSVSMACGSSTQKVKLTASDSSVPFNVRPGTCDLSLSGTVMMTQRVDVPNTGGSVRCLIRGGRMVCD